MCSEGEGNVFVVNTATMSLHCLDVASGQWTGEIPICTTYRATLASMAYCKGRLYISGGVPEGIEEACKTTVSVLVQGEMSRVRAQEEPNMIYTRFHHSMTCVSG